jgi:hypothetical protein
MAGREKSSIRINEMLQRVAVGGWSWWNAVLAGMRDGMRHRDPHSCRDFVHDTLRIYPREERNLNVDSNMAPFTHIIALFAVLATDGGVCQGYFDAKTIMVPHTTASTLPEPHPLQPAHLKPKPSMITAVAPSMALLGNDRFAMEYSIHFVQQGQENHQQDWDIFKRGVFASDPPLPTCVTCDGAGKPVTSTSVSNSNSSSIPCSTIPYSVSRSCDIPWTSKVPCTLLTG